VRPVRRLAITCPLRHEAITRHLCVASGERVLSHGTRCYSWKTGGWHDPPNNHPRNSAPQQSHPCDRVS
jgi:hypothetical protein